MSKHTLAVIAIWMILASVIYYLVDRIQNPNTLASVGTGATATLKRGPDGHYRAEALINGEKIDVLIDTGATGVAVSQSVANKLGLKSFNAIRTTTANGDTVGYLVRLDSVKIGGVEAKNVSATIAPTLEGDVLLGMSYLGRMDVRLYKGTMTITQVE
ncbi:MAG: retropepsin-like aspartic protease family protein [Methylophilus sp.]